MKVNQAALFHERIEDAIDEVIRCCGGRKAFAVALWPDKPPRDAHNLLDACLNPERRERFSPDQLLYIMRRGREVDCDAVMHYLSGECGYTTPQPIDPQDEVAKLQQTFIDSVQLQGRIAARIEQLMAAKPTLKSAA